MSVVKVAKPYAKTLVDTANESGKLENLIADINVIKQALEVRELELLFENPIVNTNKKKSVFDKVFSDKVSELTLNFLHLILRKGREGLIQDIVKATEDFILEKKDITKVVITTASEVTDETLDEIKKKVKESGETRSHLDVTHKIDEELLGGFKVEFEDNVLNASVAHKLKEMRRSFN